MTSPAGFSRLLRRREYLLVLRNLYKFEHFEGLLMNALLGKLGNKQMYFYQRVLYFIEALLFLSE